MLNEGDKAPAIKLETDKGEKFDLAKHKGKKVVVYFYPRADTPGCTIEAKEFKVINPATEEVCGHISAGSAADVDKAVKAARKAFATYSLTSREERIDLLQRILAEYQKRFGDVAHAITEEMGAPANLAQRAQAPIGMAHLSTAIEVLKSYKFEEDRGTTRIVKEPIGVCGFITPCNWPVNQIACKVAPALATTVQKPQRRCVRLMIIFPPREKSLDKESCHP